MDSFSLQMFECTEKHNLILFLRLLVLQAFQPFTCIKMIERPPDRAVRDVSEQRSHVTPVEAPETIHSKNLSHNVPGLAKHFFGLPRLRVGIKSEAREVLPLALHHQLLRDHIDWNGDALGDQGGRAAGHQRLHRVVLGILGDVLPHQLVGGYVSLARDEREGVDHEAAIKASDALRPQDLEEGVESAAVEGFAPLHLQPRADQRGRVDGGPNGHRHEHPERVELPLVEVLPLDDLDVPFLLHPDSCRCPLIRLIPAQTAARSVHLF